MYVDMYICIKKLINVVYVIKKILQVSSKIN